MSDQAESLLSGLGPELYRCNAFRVSQLTVTATQRDVTRRLEKLKMQAALGGAPEAARGPLALAPPPNEAAVRQAVERLRDPEKRLLDEVFWFWPDSPAVDGPALEAVARGDVAAARKHWQAGGTAVATHNLAVLAHLVALDLEHRALTTGPVLDSFLARMRDQAWTDAWLHWRGVLGSDEIWARLRDRIRELNEPQVPESLADGLRRGLPVALLGVNAQLAVRWAERRLPLEAQRHKDLLARSGFDALDADEAVRRALRPVRERIKMLCGTAGDSGGGNWLSALDLFKGVASLPSRGVDRDNLLEDAAPALYHVCWFCERRPGDPGAEAVVPLHGRVTRTRTGGGESVYWDRHLVEVPRCWHCSQAHQRWEMLQGLGTAPPGVRPEADKEQFPFVARYLAEGWGLGVTPETL